MKIFAYLTLLLVVFGTAWVFFLEYGNKRFVENLPKLPHSVSSPTEKAPQLDVSKDSDFSESDSSEVTRSPLAIEAERVTDADNGSDLEQTDLPELSQPLDPEQGATDADTSELLSAGTVDLRPPPGMSLVGWLDSLSPKEKQAVYLQKPWLKPIQEMTRQELETEVARQKQRLIEKFGNTPEVQMINKYTTVAHLLGEPRTLTGDEGVEYSRAMSVIWPTEENIAHYRRYKSWQENGWHVDPSEEW